MHSVDLAKKFEVVVPSTSTVYIPVHLARITSQAAGLNPIPDTACAFARLIMQQPRSGMHWNSSPKLRKYYFFVCAKSGVCSASDIQFRRTAALPSKPMNNCRYAQSVNYSFVSTTVLQSHGELKPRPHSIDVGTGT